MSGLSMHFIIILGHGILRSSWSLQDRIVIVEHRLPSAVKSWISTHEYGLKK